MVTRLEQSQDAAARATSSASTHADVAVFDWLSARLGATPVSAAAVQRAREIVAILRDSFADPELLQGAALVAAGDGIVLADIETAFGPGLGRLVQSVRQLDRLDTLATRPAPGKAGAGIETLRRMTLAMAVDIRVVLIRLAGRLQVLRGHAAAGSVPSPELARDSLEVLAPLANRLGLWQLKWELEDLSFRFLQPEAYRAIAGELEERRVEREAFLHRTSQRIERELAERGIRAQVSSRPKHIYSIHSKMRAKQIALTQVMDLRALRIIVADLPACYQSLSLIHELWNPVAGEFDDYIAKPKANGYQSLHTVVLADDGRPFEVQIRTAQMHQDAEYGLASHWAYKEASVGVAGSGRVRPGDRGQLDWLRQLLAWQQDVGSHLDPGVKTPAAPTTADEESQARIFVLTPAGRVIELPAHATPVDFAYHVHTDLGHRCRGARVDGLMVPLNTSLHNGQTVEVITAHRNAALTGPSRDWLNPGLGYLRSNRARTKVRQWFNAQQQAQALTLGRERVERAMQREGKTALALDVLASRLGHISTDDLFLAVARDELGPRALELAIRQETPESRPTAAAALPSLRPSVADTASKGAVLVVGVDLLLTQLARCCRPIPPDPIRGFVTRGRGISVHHEDCKSLARLVILAPERVVETSWGSNSDNGRSRAYGAELWVHGDDRPHLARDILDVCARDKVGVSALTPGTRGTASRFHLLVDVADAAALERTMAALRGLPGVFEVSRRQKPGRV